MLIIFADPFRLVGIKVLEQDFLFRCHLHPLWRRRFAPMLLRRHSLLNSLLPSSGLWTVDGRTATTAVLHRKSVLTLYRGGLVVNAAVQDAKLVCGRHRQRRRRRASDSIDKFRFEFHRMNSKSSVKSDEMRQDRHTKFNM